jgi:hypothetical protein
MSQNTHKSEHASSLKLAFASLLVGALAAFAITQGWADNCAPWVEPLVWVAGAMTFGFGLARFSPKILRNLFQGVGYLAVYSAMLFVVLFSLGRELPTFNGSINTGTVSGHLSRTADELGVMAEESQEGMTTAIAEIREAVGQ